MESSFQIAACECPDVSANTMAVDATGRYVLISGRKSMALVDLEGTSPDSSIPSQDVTNDAGADRLVTSTGKLAPTRKKFTRNSKYEPTASQFNKHLKDLYALTTYQTIEVFSIEDLNPSKPKLILRGHSRAIADLEWSCFDPYLLGSSGADCFTYLWDIRDSRRPSANLTSVSGATQVRFCKTSSNLIATSHEIDVRIWDIRQPNLPLNYIAAHLQKINGMDWNPNKTSCDHEQLITCSQDNTVKIWDLNMNKIKPSATLATRTPAWRIRYTPISSNAILTSTLPQLRSRAECMALRLWSMKPNRYEQKKLELILSLMGHTEVVVDFDWRASSSNSSGEIVSWSKDQSLRVWRIDNQFIEMNVENSDYEAECDSSDVICEPMESYLNDSLAYPSSPDAQSAYLSPKATTPDLTSARQTSRVSKKADGQLSKTDDQDLTMNDRYNSDQDDESSDNQSSTNELKQEFNLLNKNIPNIEFEELNSLRRVCLITARAKNVTCRLRIALPPSYPQLDCPTFTIIDSNQFGGVGLSRETKDKLLSLLNDTAKLQLSRSRNCIEPCLRKFIAALQSNINHSVNRRHSTTTGLDTKDDPITLSAQRDHSVPFPGTSGARFCGNLFVCFSRPMIPAINTSSSSGETANWSVETPRSMAQLSAQLDNMRRQGTYNLSNISISYFYYGAMRRNELQNRGTKGSASTRLGSKYIASRGKAPHGQTIMSKSYKCGPVLVYDVSHILGGICRDLAESYVFDRDVMKMCRKNAEIAAEYNRKDLVQIWSLAELSSEGVLHSHVPNKDDELSASLLNRDSDFGDRPWTMHPFGSKLIQSLIDHYVHNCHDVQTAAMLVWTFSSPKLGRSGRTTSSSSKSTSGRSNSTSNTNSALHQTTPHGAKTTTNNNIDSISDEWNFVNGPESHLYSNSWSNLTIHEHLGDCQTADPLRGISSKHSNIDHNQLTNGSSNERFPKINILSPDRSLQNDLIMHIYAEVLYKLNLLNQRAMVLKNVGTNSSYLEIFGDQQAPMEHPEDRLSNLRIQCANSKCHSICKSVQCSPCKRYALYCSICRLPVKGSSSVCIKCLHGGHINHFSTWFQSYDFCPTGCGCRCSSAEC